MQNSAQMKTLAQEVVQKAIQQCLDKSTIKVDLKSKDIEFITNLRTECFEAIYHILEQTDFSQYDEVSAIFQKMIEEKNKEFDLEGDGLKVNEKKFKINHACRIVSEALLESDTFKNYNDNIEKYLDEQVIIERDKRNSIVEFNNQKIQSLAHTDVLWAGWECDSLAWVIEQDGKNVLLKSNHGQVQITDKSFLENKIKQYEDAIESSKKLLALIQ